MNERHYVPHFERFEDRRLPSSTAYAFASGDSGQQMRVIAQKADFSAVPLDELAGTYQGRTGGLYGDGRNELPESLARAAEAASQAVRPLDKQGMPSASGKIGLLAIGQSTTRMVFDAFRSSARNARASNVVLVNGAIDGNDSKDWAERNGPWNSAIRQIGRAGASAAQIQVLWVESALLFPASYGGFAARNSVYVRHLDQIVNQAKQRFPNLRLIFFTSRYYGGWVKKTTTPEPYAYESGFGVRDFVLSKIPQAPNSIGAIQPKPVALWGPYFWTSGTKPSAIDGLALNRSDLVSDGVHPTASGAAKFANQLLRFFTQDRNARPWFTGSSA